MTDSHASEDSPAVDALLVDATATDASVARSTTRNAVAPSADVAPELHEVTDA